MPNPSSKIFWKIANWEIPDFKQDVVVMPGTDQRSWKYASFGEIVFNKWITDKMDNFAKSNGLISESYDVIHLRSGSKSWAGGHEGTQKSYAEKIKSKFPDLKTYLNVVFEDYNTKKQSDKNKKKYHEINDDQIFLISDGSWIIDEWKKRFGFGKDLKNNQYKDSSKKAGIHALNKEELKKQNISKIYLNYDMILDFHILLNSRILASDGISTYSQMAGEIKKYSSFFRFSE